MLQFSLLKPVKPGIIFYKCKMAASIWNSILLLSGLHKPPFTWLKSNEAATSSSSTEKLIGLRDLYDLVDGWLQLPSTQNFIVQNSNDNELLNGSLRLLDVCGLAKDALLQTKEDIQQLQSVFRRRRGDDAGLTNEAKAYLASRKRQASNNKSLRDLKISKCGARNDVETAFSMLRDAEGVTFSVLESVLSYMTASMPEPKLTNWSLVSKLLHSKRVTFEERASATNDSRE
ncbi:Detected protein of unknown function [Hibiscus syriacus]|uniref:Uncharacterized protein n=1 Tax=Hibiscus syriacus TaxID=106335 RepID=A0A6A2Z5Q1_HIBSY|nr:Detected protein of unknown function [Hibiscus syriacus]